MRVAIVRGVVYLNFSRNWLQGFSASLRHGERTALGAFANNPKDLEGRRVRVRGWIDCRSQPWMTRIPLRNWRKPTPTKPLRRLKN